MQRAGRSQASRWLNVPRSSGISLSESSPGSLGQTFSSLQQTAIRLRFVLLDADLFAVQFRAAP